MDKDPDAYRTISEVADALDIPPHVLRFWETKFPQIRPLKRGGGRRFYRRSDVELLQTIRRRLYEDGYTIRGVQRLLRSKGGASAAVPEPAAPPSADAAASPVSEPEPLVEATRPVPASALLERLATEIAACRVILSDALRSAPAATAPGD